MNQLYTSLQGATEMLTYLRYAGMGAASVY